MNNRMMSGIGFESVILLINESMMMILYEMRIKLYLIESMISFE